MMIDYALQPANIVNCVTPERPVAVAEQGGPNFISTGVVF